MKLLLFSYVVITRSLKEQEKKKDNALPRRASVIVSLAEIYNLLIFVQMRRVRG